MRQQWHEHHGMVVDTVNQFDVMECMACGFKHIVPIPTMEELDQVYREDYYSKEKPFYLHEHQEDLDWWNHVYDERYDRLESLLPADRRRILDVGSGPGFFLLRGKGRGWDVVGIEPSRQAADHSRGLGVEIREGFLTKEMAKTLEPFDVVHLHEVLEHIPHPLAFLKLVRGLLRPDGVLCAIVPNDYNPLQRAIRHSLQFQPWWIAPPHHINYFDHASLQRLLCRAGFHVTYQTATFPIEVFLMMGCNYVGNHDLGRLVHGQRKQLELNLSRTGCSVLKQKTYEAFAQEGIGREAVVYARVVPIGGAAVAT